MLHFTVFDFFLPYLNDGRMLKESRMTHKTNIVYLQFKLFPTHFRLGGQNGGEDDVREPRRRKKTSSVRKNEHSVVGG